MPYKFRADETIGDCAIYYVATAGLADDGPLTDPFDPANFSRLQFHTAGITPSTTEALTQQVEITIPSIASSTKFGGPSCRINLFAHGLGDACMVEGRIMDLGGAGSHVVFNGSVPVYMHKSGGLSTGFATFLALGSSTTHVFVEYFGLTRTGETRPAQTLTIEASAYDFLASGLPPSGDPGRPLVEKVPGSHFAIGRGQIDTRRRYLRRTGAGTFGSMALGPTLSIIGRGIGDDVTSGNPSYVQYEKGWRWRYSCGGYVQETELAWDGTAIDAGDYDAPLILVTR